MSAPGPGLSVPPGAPTTGPGPPGAGRHAPTGRGAAGHERTRRLSQLCRDNGHFDVVNLGDDGAGGPAGTEQVAPGDDGNDGNDGDLSAKVLQIGPKERNGHHPAVVFRSSAFGKLISFSVEPADLLLIDTPALLSVSEAMTIADRADAVLLVVNRGTSFADLRRARERLAFTDTPLIGYLLNHGLASHADAGTGARSSLARGFLLRRGAGKPPRQVRVS